MDLESKQLLERFSVNLRQLEQSYGATTLARGLAYFHEKKVIKTDRSLSLVDDEMLIVGAVSNGRGTHYLVRLRLYPGMDGLVVSSSCSCPVESDCKHGVALLFSFLSQLDTKQSGSKRASADLRAQVDNQRVTQWLEAVEGAEAERSHNAISDESDQPLNHMVHLLSLRSVDGQDELWIDSCRSRVLKKAATVNRPDCNIFIWLKAKFVMETSYSVSLMRYWSAILYRVSGTETLLVGIYRICHWVKHTLKYCYKQDVVFGKQKRITSR